MRSNPKRKKKARGLLALTMAVALLGTTAFAAGSAGEQDEDAAIMSSASTQLVSLTEEEQAYLAQHPTIVVAGDASWCPLEYRDDDTGEYAGVIAEVFSRLTEYTGLTFEYQVNDNYALALESIKAGSADMISGMANDAETAAEYNMVLTAPYLTINSAIVSKVHITDLYSSGRNLTVAVVAADSANMDIRTTLPGSQLLECDSNETCLEAVRSGRADITIIASYCAEYYMSIPRYSNLHSHTISDFSWQQAFGVSRSADPCLVSILNKGIEKLMELSINEAVFQGISGAAYDNDFMILIYRHPLVVIGIVLGVILMVGALLAVITVSRRREQMRRLEDGTRLRLALEHTHLCIWEFDLASHKILQIDNPQEKHGFGKLRENIPESVIESGCIHPDDIPLVREALQQVSEGKQDVRGRWRVKQEREGTEHSAYWWEQVLFHIVCDEHGRPTKAIGVSEDITNEMDSCRDSLTSVYNRKSFEQMAGNVLSERRNAYLQCAFLILDLDRFKQINDTYGHGMGDRVLISVGTTLNKTFRSTDIVGRLGGDEFTVFMTSISRVEDATRKANELVENIAALQKKDGFPFPISCSVGVVVAQKGESGLPELYKQADTALYEAKKAGKNQYRLYE